MLDGSKYGQRRNDGGYMSASDEEILPLEGLTSDDEEDDEEISDGQDDSRSLLDEEVDEYDEEEKELEREAWGTSRKAYYGADEASDEEDEQLEEREAERLQKKHLARLRPEDFLDTWADKPSETTATTTSGRVVIEEVPAPDLSKLSRSELLKLLKTQHPEVLRLAKLYDFLHSQLSSLSLLSQRPFHPQHNVIKLKFAVLSVLLSSIAVYFALRADKKQRKSTEKKILSKISELETTWSQISSIEIDENALDVKELIETEQAMASPEASPPIVEPVIKPKLLKRKRTKTMADESDSEEDDLTSALSILKKSRPSQLPVTDDFADPTTLHPIDALEKRQNKKTLRFYAAQIEQKGQKRREKYSGDIEVFKERKNDRNERLIVEAQKRGQQTRKEDETALDDEEPVSKAMREVDSDEDYYDFIAAKTAKKKEGKKKEYESSKAAARQFLLGQLAEEEIDQSGKRLITRQIEKNKGLMPHRSKDVRNPRVKKRKKYEKKKKALKGRQQVYQLNDRRRGAYGGEESGISKNVVKGVKLG